MFRGGVSSLFCAVDDLSLDLPEPIYYVEDQSLLFLLGVAFFLLKRKQREAMARGTRHKAKKHRTEFAQNY